MTYVGVGVGASPSHPPWKTPPTGGVGPYTAFSILPNAPPNYARKMHPTKKLPQPCGRAGGRVLDWRPRVHLGRHVSQWASFWVRLIRWFCASRSIGLPAARPRSHPMGRSLVPSAGLPLFGTALTPATCPISAFGPARCVHGPAFRLTFPPRGHWAVLPADLPPFLPPHHRWGGSPPFGPPPSSPWPPLPVPPKQPLGYPDI